MILQKLSLLLCVLALCIFQGECYSLANKRRILIKGVPSSSHVKINSGIAMLLKEMGHDVTIIFRSMDAYVDILKQKGIKVLFEPPVSREVKLKHFKIIQDYQKNGGIHNMWENVGTHLDNMFNYQQTFYQYLKEQRYDVLISEQMQYQQVLANYLEIPLFIQIMNGPGEGEFYQKSHEYVAHSTHFNLIRQFIFQDKPESQFYYRLQNFMTLVAQRSIIEYNLEDKIHDIIPVNYHNQIDIQRYQNITLILNIDGVNPNIPTSPTVRYIFPQFKQQVKPGDQQILSPELKEFYSKYEKICLVAFGTQYKPTPKQLDEIMQFMKDVSTSSKGELGLQNEWAFVYAKSDLNMSSPTDREIVQRFKERYPRILIQKFVPQVALLEHEKTQAFLSHGGSNSMLESLEAKVPIIIAPISVYDQFMHCYHVDELNLGQCVPLIKTNFLTDALRNIEQDSFYQDNLAQISQVIKQKHYDDPEDFKHWFNNVLDLGDGLSVLRSEQYHKAQWWQFQDLDIKMTFIFCAAVMFRIILKALWFIFKSIMAIQIPQKLQQQSK
eukprot:403371743